jgi:HSP20 family protein
MDVEETEKEFLVKADLPGVDPKDVDIRVVDNVLTVRGGKEEKKEERKKSYHRMERFSGQFYRAVTLPAGTDPEKVNATSANGVITITIPKRPEAQPKKIVIQPKT